MELTIRILPHVEATAEQLDVLRESRPGVLVVNGAAGSGKTTTALLRLTRLCAQWLSRKERLNLEAPVRVLVLTYNRTLEGYIRELASAQVAGDDDLAEAVVNGDIHLSIKTFSKWAVDLIDESDQPTIEESQRTLNALASGFELSQRFVTDEVEYLLGRFPTNQLESYISCIREGRGMSPRMDAAARRRLLDHVVYPYLERKRDQDLRDWHDVAAAAARAPGDSWDIVIVDEAQDFAANQVRALMAHASAPHSVTFVMDSAQRIYPRSFTWREVGITVTASRKLQRNYRNTAQIAAFARSLLEGMSIGNDGAMPDLNRASTHGPKPKLLMGKYGEQAGWAISNIVRDASQRGESVAFLHPLGGGWFDHLKGELNSAQVPFVELARASTWPGGGETVALSTIHSVKGLEFDHVVILGLNQRVTPHGEGVGDDQLDTVRRLLAMGIGRARKTVTIGSKGDEISDVIGMLDSNTYERIDI